jgi:Ser/Thr protein kinase RdoA (MazF antagonist)
MKSEDAAVAAVCAAFSLGAPITVQRVTTGYLNRNEAVTLAGGRRLFLKGSRHHDAGIVEAEHAVIRHAAVRGIPTALPLMTPDGRSVALVDSTPWSVFPYVDGTLLAGEEMPETLGTLLARTHQALASYPVDDVALAAGVMGWETEAALRETADIEVHIAAREAAGTADSFDAFTREAFATLRSILRDAPPAESVAWLPRQMIHGDCYPPNILCDASGAPIALLDWEFAMVRPRIWDVMRAIAFTFLGVHGEPMNLEAARRCVTAYRVVQLLPDDEIAAGVALYHWRTAHSLFKYRWHDERGPQPTDPLAPHELRLNQWLHEHRTAFAAYLTGNGPLPVLPASRGREPERLTLCDG